MMIGGFGKQDRRLYIKIERKIKVGKTRTGP